MLEEDVFFFFFPSACLVSSPGLEELEVVEEVEDFLLPPVGLPRGVEVRTSFERGCCDFAIVPGGGEGAGGAEIVCSGRR